MALPLVRRAGEDTVGKLEGAASRRFQEARKLQAAGEPLGAVYLYGYSVEIGLKVAYYRALGLQPGSPIDKGTRGAAEHSIDTWRKSNPVTPGMRTPSAGHDLQGWAQNLRTTRGTSWPIAFLTAFDTNVQELSACWAEFLRYRANRPTRRELEVAAKAARWFRRNSQRLRR